MARSRRRRVGRPQRRRGSFMQRLEDFVLDFVQGNSGTPSTFALAATEALGQPVRRQAVSKVLADNKLLAQDFVHRSAPVRAQGTS